MKILNSNSANNVLVRTTLNTLDVIPSADVTIRRFATRNPHHAGFILKRARDFSQSLGMTWLLKMQLTNTEFGE